MSIDIRESCRRKVDEVHLINLNNWMAFINRHTAPRLVVRLESKNSSRKKAK